MATTFKIKRFSAKTDAMKKVAEDTYYRELSPKGEKLGAAIKREGRNVGRYVKMKPIKSAGIAGGVALTGMVIGGGIKGYKNSKKQKTYSIPRMFSEEGKMSTGKKLLLGAGTLAAGVAGAKTGILGKTAKLGINKAQFGLGKTIGSKGLMKDAIKGQRETLGKVKVPQAPSTQLALPSSTKLLN